ncbi:MAG: gamma-glutamyltransferase [Myxococcales bacterium]|nr:gamma-glutamyltransferase [Myxococcales bacterium]
MAGLDSRGLSGVMGIVALVFLVSAAPYPQTGVGVVAADHQLASQAGAELLRRGGNAVDAAVAAALSAGVVQPAGSGLGGGGFAVGSSPGGKRFVLDFREVAPSAATENMFRTADGAADPEASRSGGLAVAVPGEPVGLAELVREHGRSSLRAVAAPAIRQASRGFEVGPHLAKALSRTKYPSIRSLLSGGSGPATVGQKIRRPALAKALRTWAGSGGRGLNSGSSARAIVRAARGSGGVLTTGDIEGYTPRRRDPLVGRYRAYTVVTMPPPSSGGVALLQLLSVLEEWDLPELGHNSSEMVHLLAEAMKHAYADRAHHLGDPDHVTVPVERLLSPERTEEIRRAIYPSRTFGTEHYGDPVAPPRDAGTQHISVMDDEGGAVALTTTINTAFGSGVVVPELGYVLNNEMDDFAAAPGQPNAYGLVGTEANAVAAGKRPLSSMTPTLVLDGDGRVVLAVGASGGGTIISATAQVLVGILDFGMNPQEAVSAPRMHHQWLPDTLWLEPGFSADVVRSLRARGHEVTVRDGFSAVQAVVVREDGLAGGSDPRKGGWPASVRRAR